MNSHVSEGARARLSRGERLIVALAPFVVRLLYATWRVKLVDVGEWQVRRRRGEPTLFTFWHGAMLPLLVRHREEGITVLISEHKDGELIARIVERLGFRTVRGSTTRGGVRALAAISQVLRLGGEVAVTPDGPRGPAHTFAPGALLAAQRTGVPVVAVGVYASRAWRLRSWDAFMIPKPFAIVTVAYSNPTFVGAPDVCAAATQTGRFELLMNDTTARAQLAVRAAR